MFFIVLCLRFQFYCRSVFALDFIVALMSDPLFPTCFYYDTTEKKEQQQNNDRRFVSSHQKLIFFSPTQPQELLQFGNCIIHGFHFRN